MTDKNWTPHLPSTICVCDSYSPLVFRYYTEGEGSLPAAWRHRTAMDSLLQVLHLRLRFMRNSPYHFWLDKEET